MSKAEELARVQVLLDTYADECFSDGKEIGGRVPSDRTLAARKALMDGISRLAGANPPAKIEQAAEPVAVFKEDKSFGHVEFIPFQGPPLKEGDKLYTHPAPRSPDMQDAYIGAMEDLSIWKRRALEAEELNRKFIAETNGPTLMGEPLLPAHPAPRKPMTANEIWNADEIMSVNADAQISFVHIQRFVRAVERFHDVKE